MPVGTSFFVEEVTEVVTNVTKIKDVSREIVGICHGGKMVSNSEI